jgi:hypothetical protein
MTHPGRVQPAPSARERRSAPQDVPCSTGMYVIHYPAEAARYAAAIVRRHLPGPSYRVFLFGSRGTGSDDIRYAAPRFLSRYFCSPVSTSSFF